MTVLHHFEAAILLFLQEHVRNGALSALLVPLTQICDHGELWLGLCFLLLCFRPTRKAGALALLSLLLCWGSSEFILKNLVHRARPFTAIQGLIPAVPPPHSTSFPSGHSCSSMAAAGTHFRVLKHPAVRWGIVIVALLVLFSRMYVGVHYPTDVLAGGLWGWVGSGIVVRYFAPKWEERFEKEKNSNS